MEHLPRLVANLAVGCAVVAGIYFTHSLWALLGLGFFVLYKDDDEK